MVSKTQYKETQRGPTADPCSGHSPRVPGRQEPRTEWRIKSQGLGQEDVLVCGSLKTRWGLLPRWRDGGKCVIGHDQWWHVIEKEAARDLRFMFHTSRHRPPSAQRLESYAALCRHGEGKISWGGAGGSKGCAQDLPSYQGSFLRKMTSPGDSYESTFSS